MIRESSLTGIVVALLFVSHAHAQVTINEIRTDDPGTDNSEHFELKGTPSTALDGYTYVVIGDAMLSSGAIEAVLDLAGFSLDTDGLLDIASNDSLNTPVLPFCGGDWTVFGPLNLNFENSDNVTHLLVTDFTGADGQDLDTDDDGVLDVTPWTQVIDSVALIHSTTSGELVYSSTQIGPDGGVQPAHVYRCDNGWQLGTFAPECGTDTPGEPNDCPPVGVEAGLDVSSWGRTKAAYR